MQLFHVHKKSHKKTRSSQLMGNTSHVKALDAARVALFARFNEGSHERSICQSIIAISDPDYTGCG